MGYVLVVLVVVAALLVLVINLAQSGTLPQLLGAAPQGFPGGASARWRLVMFYPQDDTPQCVEAAKAFDGLAMDKNLVDRYFIAVADDARCVGYRTRYGLQANVVADPSGRLAKACGVFVNLVFLKLAKKAVFIVNPSNQIVFAKLINEIPKDFDDVGKALMSNNIQSAVNSQS